MTQIDGVADHAPDTTATDVEPKVKAATIAATLVSFVLWALSSYVFRGEVPLPVQGVVGLAATGGATFVAGYLARHVNRS